MSVAVVTGCSTGIGFATAAALARLGHEVIAGMRNPSGAPELAQLATAEKLPITVIRMDVDSDESVRSSFQTVFAEKGRIDVLVNNAGIVRGGPVEELEIEEFHKVMETNFFGALRCTQAVLSKMREQRSGHIVNVSSLAGRVAVAGQGAYAASKWALEAATEILAQEVWRLEFGWRSSNRASSQLLFLIRFHRVNTLASIRNANGCSLCFGPHLRIRYPPRWSATRSPRLLVRRTLGCDTQSAPTQKGY